MTRRDIIDTEQKTAAENARDFVFVLCVGFTITMVIALAIGSFFADGQVRQGINYCWSLLGVCAAAATLQFLFFTPTIIKRLSYPLRLAAFGICLYAVLAVVAVSVGWFPASVAGAWVTFTVSYAFALAIASAFFAIKQRRESRKLNDKLAEYRKEAR